MNQSSPKITLSTVWEKAQDVQTPCFGDKQTLIVWTWAIPCQSTSALESNHGQVQLVRVDIALENELLEARSRDRNNRGSSMGLFLCNFNPKEREDPNSFPEPNRNNTCAVRERTCRNANMFSYLGWICHSYSVGHDQKTVSCCLLLLKSNTINMTRPNQHPNSSLVLLWKHPFLPLQRFGPAANSEGAEGAALTHVK